MIIMVVDLYVPHTSLITGKQQQHTEGKRKANYYIKKKKKKKNGR